MHRNLAALAVLIVCTGCKERSVVDMPPNTIRLPTLSIRENSDEKSLLIATVSNPSSSELSIPGFDGKVIYGSYWYQGDKMISIPECGTGFWDSVIKIPAGQTRELSLPIPRAVTRGKRFTVAIVYGGLGPSAVEQARKDVSLEEWIRHPDLSLGCRKMETDITLAEK